MARVVTDAGQDLGEVTGALLEHYRREPGFVIDGETVEANPEPEADEKPAKARKSAKRTAKKQAAAPPKPDPEPDQQTGESPSEPSEPAET